MAQRRYWVLGLWLLALWAAHWPWTTHPTAAFTLNSFDLAEQIRIHPAILAQTPPLRTSALLWAIFPLTALAIALTAYLYQSWWARWGLWGLAGLVALRVIPPQQLLRNPSQMLSDDYGQTLFFLTLLGLVLVGLMMIGGRWLAAYHRYVSLVTIVFALAIPLVGFWDAYSLMQELQLQLGVGAGIVGYGGALAGLAWLHASEPSPQ